MKSKVTFTPGELQTPLYRKLKTHWEARLEELRRKNDGPLPPELTAYTRGQIEEIKLLLKAGSQPQESE